jgi:hypothetical protein
VFHRDFKGKEAYEVILDLGYDRELERKYSSLLGLHSLWQSRAQTVQELLEDGEQEPSEQLDTVEDT